MTKQDVTCPQERVIEDMSKKINALSPEVHRQAGQWVILLVALGLISTTVGGGLIYMHQLWAKAQAEIMKSQSRIEIAVVEHLANSVDGFRRITASEVLAEEHEHRIQTIESLTLDHERRIIILEDTLK